MILLMFSFLSTNAWSDTCDGEWPEYGENPFKIKLDSSQHHLSGRGGIIVSDLNGDCLLDYIVSSKENDFGEGRASIGAYDHRGGIIWIKDNIDIALNGKAEINGLPGWSGPGISAADVDSDGKNEIIYLSSENEIIIMDGSNGSVKKRIAVGLPEESLFSKIGISFFPRR